jgi:hypothetical protein
MDAGFAQAGVLAWQGVAQRRSCSDTPCSTALRAFFHGVCRYIEVDVDVASTQAVAYIVKMVQGATRSMLIDHAYLLEAQFAHELPEQLIGAIRYARSMQPVTCYMNRHATCFVRVYDSRDVERLSVQLHV